MTIQMTPELEAKLAAKKASLKQPGAQPLQAICQCNTCKSVKGPFEYRTVNGRKMLVHKGCPGKPVIKRKII